MKKNYYEVLGLRPDASAADIKKAYRRLARKYHPDVSREPDAESKFKAVQEAYDILGDEDARKEYDEDVNDKFDEGYDGARGLAILCIRAAIMDVTGTGDVPLKLPGTVLAHARRELELARQTINRKVEEAKIIARDVSQLKQKTRRRGRGANLFEHVLGAELDKLQAFIDRHPERIEEIRRAKQILDDYEDGASLGSDKMVLARLFGPGSVS